MLYRENLYLVVIAGGSGTRFWPKSTSKRPKQLLTFGTESHSLLSQTLSRFSQIIDAHHRMIVTTAALDKTVQEENLDAQIFAEPQGRNTAPCIYWAARLIMEKNPQSIMIVLPSDHYIADVPSFIETVKAAAEWASSHPDLITLGIHPTRPETGYGYLKVGESLTSQVSQYHPKHVLNFVEKPNAMKAQEFLNSGNYLWNGGMFIWQTKTILKAFDQFMPEMEEAWAEANGNIEQAYPKMTATSIDYGIMEKAKNVVAFPLDCGWDDLGSWTSLETLGNQLKILDQGNFVNQGELIAIDSKKNIVDVKDGKLVALLGVNNLIIAENENALLIADKSRAQDLRKVVEEVKQKRPDLI